MARRQINLPGDILKAIWLSLLCLGLFLPFAAVPAAAAADVDIPLRADEQVLAGRAFQFWQHLNDARRDPLAAARRLNIPEETVRVAFSDQLWVLEQGLPPLAWNDHLRSSASGHGRDMFNRLFYSYITPEGVNFDQRIAATGYESQFTGETIIALFFEAFVPLDEAFDLLADSLLRDELTGSTAVQRNIFDPEITEAGISFFAESIDLLNEQPFVYLLVADFAAPLTPAPYLVGVLDDDSRLAVRSPVDGRWTFAPLLASGAFQLLSPLPGTFLVTVTENGIGPVGASMAVNSQLQGDHQFVDLRRPITTE